MSDASIRQHKPAFKALDDGLAFGDGGERVPVVDFDFDAVDGEQRGAAGDSSVSTEDVQRLLRQYVVLLYDEMTSGCESPEEVGRRVLLMRHQSSGETLLQLAGRLKVTEARASQLFKDFKNLSRKQPIKTRAL